MPDIRFVGAASGNYSKGRSNPPQYVTMHIMVGTLSGTSSWFNNPASRVSSNYGIGKYGAVYQFVREEDTPYSDGYKNSNTISIEMENASGHPYPLAVGVWEAAVWLAADILRRKGWPADSVHIRFHRDLPGVSTSCPGEWFYSRRGDFIAAVGAALGQQGPLAPSAPPSSQNKSNEDLAHEVIAGRWGNGSDRQRRLADAGYDYSAIQALVNRILLGGSGPVSKPGTGSVPAKTVEQLAYEVIDGRWGNGSARRDRLIAAGFSYTAVQARVNQILSGR